MNEAHAALFFDIDRTRNGAFLRAWDGPEEIWGEAVVPLDADPAGFVLDRGRAFYATDFRSLLWSLPYYKTQKRIGTLLAVPVLVPSERYGMMRNVWFIPSPPAMLGWLRRAGFRDARLADLCATTTGEQRRTTWMRFESLADFLDPVDPRRTREGYPAPLRAVFIASRPR